MKHFYLFLCLLLAHSTTYAQSVLVGKRLVSKGDDIVHVRDIAGPADRVDKIPADEFSPAMEIWTYHNNNGQQVVLWIVGTKVVQAQEQAAATAPAR